MTEYEDIAREQAILNIQSAMQRISKFGSNRDIADAVAQLAQAIRYLRGEEDPS